LPCRPARWRARGDLSLRTLRRLRTLKGVQASAAVAAGRAPAGAERAADRRHRAEAKTPKARTAGLAPLLRRRRLAMQPDSTIPLALDQHPTRMPRPRQGDLPRPGLLSVDHGRRLSVAVEDPLSGGRRGVSLQRFRPRRDDRRQVCAMMGSAADAFTRGTSTGSSPSCVSSTAGA